ncbi:hypothetical protein AVEN_136754-1 [Araneus ventricosus]|uniref:Uncharacterized protein n=1 Tax=Araneus ventricosus TaxID=182803 RepID=A0A4Y2UTG4_ARAVE|nr:hypothetical protein AVEN_63955-1 [Araneus ventricosus]GBO15471.1 hypothetical protein AVEN_136754-1 [Araneus ventricosus]
MQVTRRYGALNVATGDSNVSVNMATVQQKVSIWLPCSRKCQYDYCAAGGVNMATVQQKVSIWLPCSRKCQYGYRAAEGTSSISLVPRKQINCSSSKVSCNSFRLEHRN